MAKMRTRLEFGADKMATLQRNFESFDCIWESERCRKVNLAKNKSEQTVRETGRERQRERERE